MTTLGRTDDEISPIGFGGMRLSIQGRPPEDVGRAVIRAAIDAGITLIDTAGWETSATAAAASSPSVRRGADGPDLRES
ncbi:MAG TPA: hypothetical protein VF962_02685 [Gemmatimonadaceae bacterium]